MALSGSRFRYFRCTACLLILAFCFSCLSGCALSGRSSSTFSVSKGSSGSSGSGGGGGTPKGVSVKKGARGTKPYTVRGKTYYPLLSSHGFREEGTASWYGRDFHGKLTANGERYSMYGMTAAHKLLPFGTNVRVTNTRNGKSIVVRINDRGPFVDNRIIDLTKTGAERLGMIKTGTAPVVLTTEGSVKGLQNNDLSGRFFVQVGAFSSKANAEGLVAMLKGKGFSARVKQAPGNGLWRVQVGPYASLVKSEQAADSLRDEFPKSSLVAD